MKKTFSTKFTVFLVATLVISMVCFFTNNNTLNAVTVNTTKAGYQVVLNANDVAKIKRTIDSPNKMILEIKDIKQSQAFTTNYKNAKNVESVVVLPSSRNDLKIIIDAKNIAQSTLAFNTQNQPIGTIMPAMVNGSAIEDMKTTPLSWLKNNIKFDLLMYFSAFALLIMFALKAFGKNEVKLTLADKELAIQNQIEFINRMKDNRLRQTKNYMPSLPNQNHYQDRKVDSLQFLESMSRIYEKNGRHDLARELKVNIRKAQLSKQAV